MTHAETRPAVPYLTTAMSGPLCELESHLLDRQHQIEGWFRAQWRHTPAPFYTSVDLRNSGFKLAPVDTNLFPAGFNNLNPVFEPLSMQAIQSAIERFCPDAIRVMIIPEGHTRNMFYLESLATLENLIDKAGFETRIAALSLDTPVTHNLPSGRIVSVLPVTRKDDRLVAGDYDPCLIILNNDMSSDSAGVLNGLSQIVTPPVDLGWAKRLKSGHFKVYRELAKTFATMAEIDPWLVDPLFRNCGEINFVKREGEDCLADNVQALLATIQKKYKEYQIDTKPFVIVKADAGTYGMAVMTVESPDDIRSLNRKQRVKMSTTKGGVEVRRVIMQEGVHTYETWGETEAVAEPVVYMIDRFVVGGFYRVHTRRGPNENLNAPGMHFEPLAFAEPCSNPDMPRDPDAAPNRFYAYGVVGRLAMLAAAREIAATHNTPEKRQLN
ncbi:MAG: glutamate--cysteine ligase [Gammaproteobacteria bacterium]|nr:MAG: glutamate--cysteine ligase [Gammaproteobacteria bacterium]